MNSHLRQTWQSQLHLENSCYDVVTVLVAGIRTDDDNMELFYDISLAKIRDATGEALCAKTQSSRPTAIRQSQKPPTLEDLGIDNGIPQGS